MAIDMLIRKMDKFSLISILKVQSKRIGIFRGINFG